MSVIHICSLSYTYAISTDTCNLVVVRKNYAIVWLKSFFNLLFQCEKKATQIKMWLWFITTILVVFICYKKLSKPKEDKIVLQKPDFKKDIVYLVQFPISPTIRTISPFALKLETYLRLKKVPYECVYSFKFSKKGQIPYIELNGEQIADSNIIIQELENKGM